MSSCNVKPLCPAPHWEVTVGNFKLTQAKLFCVPLLVGCDGLELDAAHFRGRTTGTEPGNSLSKICHVEAEDAHAHY